MHFAFVDFVYFYDAARPDSDEPLGGTTSAICFLARELVKTGVKCTFFNRVNEPQAALGIKSLPLHALSGELANDDYDVFIFCGRWSADLVALVRAHTKKPLIAWMHESAFKSPMVPALSAFDGVVYVSEWQRRVNRDAVKSNWKEVVIHNAINPVVAESNQPNEAMSVKSQPPLLLFVGSFARGAFHVPYILDRVRKASTNFEVEMFCNIDPSRDPEKDASYIRWLRGLPNITHVGMVGQRALAQRMRKASVLMAPNTWPETSCIALMECLASGMSVVATNRAALPETASGYASLVPVENPDETARFDMAIDYDAFAKEVSGAIEARANQEPETKRRLAEQVQYFQERYVWKNRVAPWIDFVKSLAK